MLRMNRYISILLLAATACIYSSCNKLLDADLPNDAIPGTAVFTSDNTALSAISGIYSYMIVGADPVYLTNGGISVTGGLCSDELYDFTTTYNDYTNNQIVYSNYGPVYYHWTSSYTAIYSANAAIAGLAASTGITASVKQQLLGEAYFIRAFCYFYLVNLYGDVPLLTSTDYTANGQRSRDDTATVYKQIVEDLQQAESLLTTAYPSAEEVRPNKYVAEALMARVYLYQKNWAAAEAKATEVMAGPYHLEPDVNNVFLKANSEAIWQLKPVSSTSANAWDARWFIPATGTPKYVMNDGLLNTFEADDKRKAAWVGTFTYQGQDYPYPAKYKNNTTTSVTEYIQVLRLSELYLIRSEARAQQGSLTGAIQDVDSIRSRAGLPLIATTNPGISQTALLDAIAHERRVELFAEWGHRWFDLLRTGKADEVLGALKTTWDAHAKLWPIPQKEINANSNLKQNEGY